MYTEIEIPIEGVDEVVKLLLIPCPDMDTNTTKIGGNLATFTLFEV